MSPAENAELSQQWLLMKTPLNEVWSGRTRYAAAMFFHMRGDLTADELEIYRICSRLDHEDPLKIMADRGIGHSWRARFSNNA